MTIKEAIYLYSHAFGFWSCGRAGSEARELRDELLVVVRSSVPDAIRYLADQGWGVTRKHVIDIQTEWSRMREAQKGRK